MAASGMIPSISHAPRVRRAAFTGAGNKTVMTYDFASAAEVLGAMDNMQIDVLTKVLGRTAGAKYCRFARECSFAREAAGNLSQVDAAPFTLSTDFVDATLVGMDCTLITSTTSLIVQVTTVGDITLTGYLWFFTTGYP